MDEEKIKEFIEKAKKKVEESYPHPEVPSFSAESQETIETIETLS